MDKELYALQADLVAIAHILYAATIVFGLIFVLIGYLAKWQWVKNRWLRGIHLLMIAVVVAEAWLGIVCPLTTLEKYLRRKAGQPFDGDSVIAQVIHQLLFFDAPWWVFTACYTVCGVLILSTLVLVPPNWSGQKKTQLTANPQ